MSVGPASNAIPFHLARAYGAAPITPTARTAPVAVGAETLRVSADTKAERPAGIDRLVAGVVAGRVDFSGSTAQARVGAASLPLYTRPGDLNEAATAVRLGRSLDVEG